MTGITQAGAGNTAVERTVWAEVTHVAPITHSGVINPDPHCAGPKPKNASLEDLLQWDLHADCQIERYQQVYAYQVSYTWDGRSYTLEMQEQPGPRIPLRLRIR